MFKSNFLIAFVVLVVLWVLDFFVLHLIGGLITCSWSWASSC